MSVKISIIIPVYNCAKYIAECIDSIIGQSLVEIELIILNDCSADHTQDIIDIYVQKDSRIFSYENSFQMGAAKTRNKGMTYATGKYIYFFDGDDVLGGGVLESAYNKLEFNEADLIELNIVKFNDEYERVVQRSNKRSFIGEKYTTIYEQKLYSYGMAMWATGTQSKIYRREFIEDNHIEYQNIESANDVFFNRMALYSAQNVVIEENYDAVVYVREHTGADRISKKRNPFCEFYAILKLQLELKARGMWKKAYQYFYYDSYNLISYALKQSSNDKIRIEFGEFIKEVGLPIIIEQGVEEFNKLDTELKDLYAEYLNCEDVSVYRLRWLNAVFTIGINRERILNLARKKNISIWGCGEYGSQLIKILEEQNIKIQYIFDNNPNGTIKTSNYENVYDCVECIIVSTGKYYSIIEKQIRDLNSKCEIINLMEYLAAGEINN